MHSNNLSPPLISHQNHQAALAKASTPPANPANGHRLLLFLGVMSAPVTTRRTTLRSTWLGDHLTRSR